MEALLAEDSCTGSASDAMTHPAAPAPSPGTSSRRIIPGRTMVVVRTQSSMHTSVDSSMDLLECYVYQHQRNRTAGPLQQTHCGAYHSSAKRVHATG